ncbi:MAG: hypothetical protein IJK19_00005 [Bacteroidales bacterium]|nr:hypothetical protein [Bacteroidales bacterium]
MLSSQSGLILSENYLPEFTYVNLGELLAKALKDEDLSGRFLPMKAWDALKSIMADNTIDGTLAVSNFNILFEPALKINLNAFLKEAMTGRQLILKLEHPVAGDWHYYPFPEDHTYYLDLTGINSTTC